MKRDKEANKEKRGKEKGKAKKKDRLKLAQTRLKIYRGYYTAARRYEFYFQVVKTIFYERALRVSKILFFTTRK